MRSLAMTVLLVLFAALSSPSQAAEKLKITGTVVSLKTSKYLLRTEKIDKWPYELQVFGYQPNLNLNIQFLNLTDHPLIILKPVLFGPTTALSFLRETSSVDEITGGTFISTLGKLLSSKAKVDDGYLREARSAADKFLSEKLPSKDYFEIIPPYTQYETMVSFNNVEVGYKVEKRVGEKPTDIYYDVVPRFPALKIRFSLKSNGTKGTNDLAMARDNWRKYGELVLDSDGDYNVKSEVILNPSGN
jgi:hypothetical protein